MTPDEKLIKKYVNDIERHLNLPLKTKARINTDLGTDIHARMEAGQTVGEIIEELGSPEEVAERFNSEMGAEPQTQNKIIKIVMLLLLGISFIYLLYNAVYIWKIQQDFQNTVNVIGGVDGPTSVFIAPQSVSLIAIMLSGTSLILGTSAACMLSWRGKHDTCSWYKKCIVLSGIALFLAVVGIIYCAYTRTNSGILQWEFIAGATQITFSPEGIISLVTLLVSIRWYKANK